MLRHYKKMPRAVFSISLCASLEWVGIPDLEWAAGCQPSAPAASHGKVSKPKRGRREGCSLSPSFFLELERGAEGVRDLLAPAPSPRVSLKPLPPPPIPSLPESVPPSSLRVKRSLATTTRISLSTPTCRPTPSWTTKTSLRAHPAVWHLCGNTRANV